MGLVRGSPAVQQGEGGTCVLVKRKCMDVVLVLRTEQKRRFPSGRVLTFQDFNRGVTLPGPRPSGSRGGRAFWERRLKESVPGRGDRTELCTRLTSVAMLSCTFRIGT